FIHVAGLVQFSNFSWVNILKPSIIVGIANVDRRRDFTYPTTIEKDKKDFPTTGGSEKFISFIEKELLPFIEKNYKTNASRPIIGQSLGGLLATEILFKKPVLFNNYIIVSPSLWWDNGSILPKKSVTPEFDNADKISVYIAVGKEGKVMVGGARQLACIIKGMQKPLVKVSFEYFEKEDHATIFHQAVYNGFKALNTK
nr:alpha/beta hydrolase [Bacteroidota bacterium]